jgi:hypothetical protein
VAAPLDEGDEVMMQEGKGGTRVRNFAVNRYRRGSVGVTDRFFHKTEPTEPAYSVNRSKTLVNRTGLSVLKTVAQV